MARKYNTELFIMDVSKVHPNLIFENTVYINPKIKVSYECPKHGQKESYPYNLLKGCGCKNCNSEKPKISRKEWIERFSKNKDFNNIDYNFLPNEFKAEDMVIFSCKIHGIFKQTPLHHLKSNCPFCGFKRSAIHNSTHPSGWSYYNWEQSANESNNFDCFKVYVIKCWNETEMFYKIGKTFLPIKLRFRSNGKTKMPYKYEVVETYIFNNAKDCSVFEKTLQKNNLGNKYVPLLPFNGMQECYADFNAAKNILCEGIALNRQREAVACA